MEVVVDVVLHRTFVHHGGVIRQCLLLVPHHCVDVHVGDAVGDDVNLAIIRGSSRVRRLDSCPLGYLLVPSLDAALL
jgi:hypothetical protein